MKKHITLAFFISIFIAFYFVYQNHSKQNNNKRELLTELTPLECDLSKTQCEYDFLGKKVIIDINPKPIYMLEELTVRIKNLNEYKNLNAQIYGLNMYMGTISDEFEKDGDDYITTIRLSTCQTKIMRFRIELFDGDDSIGLFGDFDVIQE